MTELSAALAQAIRVEELRRHLLLDLALLNRDLRAAIKLAIAQIDRGAHQLARLELLQALDEMPYGQRRRER